MADKFGVVEGGMRVPTCVVMGVRLLETGLTICEISQQ